jgi:hypothetical protein
MSLMMMTTTLMKIMMICSLFNLDKTFNKSVLTFEMHVNVFSIKYKMHTYIINCIYVWKRTVVKTSLNRRRTLELKNHYWVPVVENRNNKLSQLMSSRNIL